MNTVTVTVEVYEGTMKVAERTIRYFEGEDYEVTVGTKKHGADLSVELKAGVNEVPA